MRRLLPFFACLALLCGTSSAFAKAPLLAPGKKTLYQRVITHPEAAAFRAPNAGEGDLVRSFTPFYVYSRQMINNESWLEVGPDTGGANLRWIRGEACSRWDKALTMQFADRMSRDPVFFFKSRDALELLITSDNLHTAVGGFVAAHGSGAGKDTPLVAMEPKASAIPQNQFYLMPIFDYSLDYDQHNMKLLKVGCVNPGEVPAGKAGGRRFNAGIALIVDTTISMKPIIEQTKTFIRDTYDVLEKSPVAGDVSLAVVAYRNSTRHDPGLEYEARVVSPFAPVRERAKLEGSLKLFDEARVSTHSFDEDAFAGIKAAVDQLDWSGRAVKLAVLVTDAGAIRNNDKYSSTGLNEDEMRDLLQQKGIRLLVVHLQTPSGKRNNLPRTERQYRALTTVHDANLKSVYLALPAPNAAKAQDEFAKLSASLGRLITGMVEKAAAGEEISRPETKAPVSPAEHLAYITQSIGYAARLDFIGRENNEQAPRLVEAWTVDKDLVSLSEGAPTESLVVSVLLSKRQLDSLARQLEIVLTAAQTSRSTESGRLFSNIISLSAQTLRDPGQLQSGKASTNIAEMGVLPEFLEGLPYVSRIMGMSQARWDAMSGAEQDEFVTSLESKLKLYEEYHNDTANWMAFGGNDPAEALYRVPLTSLP